MERQDVSSAPQGDASRPSLGFPLGTALLLIVIFSLSGIFSCCYHWDKLRSFRRQQSHQSPFSHHPESPPPPHSHTHSNYSPPYKSKLDSTSMFMPVLMPGDEVPKFIAMPCPCQPSRPDNIVLTVDKPPPKPPRLPVPLY